MLTIIKVPIYFHYLIASTEEYLYMRYFPIVKANICGNKINFPKWICKL